MKLATGSIMIILLLMASVVVADEEFTTINVVNRNLGPSGSAFGQDATLGGNVKLMLDGMSSGTEVRLTSHENPFEESYDLRLVVQEPMNPNGIVPRHRWPYTGVSYGSMKIDFITIDNVEATLIQTDRFEEPQPRRLGRADIKVRATTSVDERRPPREVRTYSIKVTLRNVRGIRPDGTEVALGNFIVIFMDRVVFVHSPARVPEPVIAGGCCGGGQITPPEELGASGPWVEAGSGFQQVINTLQQYLIWSWLAPGDDVIVVPEDPIIIEPEDRTRN